MERLKQALLSETSYFALRAGIGAPRVSPRHSFPAGLRNDGTLRNDIAASTPFRVQALMAAAMLEADHAQQ
jgi:hypothetical protein